MKKHSQKKSFLLVFSTINSIKEAQKIATTLVKEKLAACVNITSKIRSIYSWKGKLCNEDEFLMLIKTRGSLYSRLEKRIRELHPYEVPEVIAVPIEEGSKAYLDWVVENTNPLNKF
jgi:periplasmic divalent cation tolerance protein